jgi:hypothetical protein
MLDTQLYHLDLSKISKEVWQQLNKMLGSKSHNATKHYFAFKMSKHESISSRVNAFKALIQQCAKVGVKVEEDEAKVVLINNLPSKYSNLIFTLSNIPSWSLKTMISTLMVDKIR